MTDPIKRLNYFDHQFLTAEDFKAEQQYHLDMRRRLNQALYSSGVISGLTVTKADDKHVKVSSGIAIDHLGREIVLVDDIPSIDLSSFTGSSTIYITIAYSEALSDLSTATGIKDYTRIMEKPNVQAVATVHDDNILLAQFTLKNGIVPTENWTQITPQMMKIRGDLNVTGNVDADTYTCKNRKPPFQS